MKLIIHIGTEKTGSSSLQLWGAINREQLLKDNVFYSQILGELDHRKASVYAREHHLRDDGFERFNIKNEDEHKSFCINLENQLKEEVEFAKQSGCKVFFVSSEHFHSRIDNNTMVARVKMLFEQHFDDIEILAYLRPQADLFESRLSVSVRNMTHDLDELTESWSKEVTYFNYNELWNRWTQVFDKVNFRPFNECKNIILDVSKILNIDLANYPEAKRVNEKLDYRVGLLTFHLRKHLTPLKIRKELVNIYIESLPCEFPIKISRNLASRIDAFYRKSNLALCSVNPGLLLHHLNSDVKKFEVDGTADKMFEDNTDIDFMLPILIRNGLEMHLQKCEGKLIEVERALARKNNDNAKRFKIQFNEMMQIIDDVKFNTDLLSELSNKTKNLKNRINKLNIG